MPLTVPAHQLAMLPVKLAWPRYTDATAMCIGSAAPDLGNAVVGGGNHGLASIMFSVPFTLIMSALIRWRAGAGVFANLPDLGPFRVHSYRVIVTRRPAWWITLLGACFGVATHILIDAFTHAGRWGATWVGLNDHLLTLPIRGDLSEARALQYVGHTLGSLAAALLILHIGRGRLLERWYGTDAVAVARRFELTRRSRWRFWTVVTAFTVLSTGLLTPLVGQALFTPMLGAAIGLVVGGSLPEYRDPNLLAVAAATRAGPSTSGMASGRRL